jgi:RHS repeat-associated protein
VDEGNTATFTVSLSCATTFSQTVDYTTQAASATAGSDYTTTSGTLTFAAGDTSKQVTVSTATDQVDENNETFQLVLSNSTYDNFAANTATATIVDAIYPPVLDSIGNKSVIEHSLLQFTATASDIDTPSNLLSYSISSGALSGMAINSSSGVFTWTPSEAQGPGSYSVTIRVSDNTSPTALTDTETITITVGEINNAPNAVDDAWEADADISLHIGGTGVLANDSDPDPTSDTLQVTTTTVTTSLGATVVMSSDGSFTYDPSPSEDLQELEYGSQLEDSFTYTVTDGSLTDTATVTITVNGMYGALIERAKFRSEFSKSYVIQSGDEALRFTWTDLDFDTADSFINDAFELALVDTAGRPLVGTIAGGRDASFNFTEGESAVAANGVYYDAANNRVTFDVRRLAVGTEVRLVARLVNNDADTTTMVVFNPTIASVSLPSQLLNATFATAVLPRQFHQAIDFGALTDVTPNTATSYYQTSFNEASSVLTAFASLENAGRYSVRSPLIVVIKNIDQPLVSVSQPEDYTPQGWPYFDVSSQAFSGPTDTWNCGESTSQFQLAFYNPLRLQFDYDLQVLGHLNEAPAFVSSPNLEVVAGKNYIYPAAAVDPEADGLTYALAGGPSGLAVNSSTGLLTWSTSSGDAGNHAVTLRVTDSYGASATQTFTIAVVSGVPNRPPVFTSTPVVDAYVGLQYTYQAAAFDADSDTLTFDLESAPVGMSIEASTGLITWENPPATLVGQSVDVSVSVDDGQGGEALQFYHLAIHANPANSPPRFTTTAKPTFAFAGSEAEAVGNVSPLRISHRLSPGGSSSPADVVTVDLPEQTEVDEVDIVFVVDESSSMSGAHDWLGSAIFDIDDSLGDAGVSSRRYGLVGFGNDDGLEVSSTHIFTLDEFGHVYGDATALADATLDLQSNGVFEDGYDAINVALTSFPFRSNAVKKIVLVTDEDRDILNSDLDFAEISNDLAESGVLFDVIASAQFRVNPPPSSVWVTAGGDVDAEAVDSLSLDATSEDAIALTLVPAGENGPDFGNTLLSAEVSYTLIDSNATGGVIFVFNYLDDGNYEFAGVLDGDLVVGHRDSGTITIEDSASITTSSSIPLYIRLRQGFFEISTDIVTEHLDWSTSYRPSQGGIVGFVAINSTAEVSAFDTTIQRFGSPDFAWNPLAATVDSTGSALWIDAEGGVSTGLDVSASWFFDDTAEDYANLAWAHAGRVWDLAFLEASNIPNDAFTDLFVSELTESIASRLYLLDIDVPSEWADLIGSDPDVVLSGAGASVDLPITFVGNGIATVFPLSVVDRLTNEIIATVPVLLNADYLYPSHAVDDDGDPLTYELVGDTHGATIDEDTGLISWVPEGIGEYDFTIRVSDPNGGEDFQHWTVEVAAPSVENEAPELEIEDAFAVADRPLSIQLSAEDAENDQLSYYLLGPAFGGDEIPEGLTLDSVSGWLTWTPTADQVDEDYYEIAVRVMDSAGNFTDTSFSILVGGNEGYQNNEPDITTEELSDAAVGERYLQQLVATDADADPLSFELLVAPKGMVIDPSSGVIGWIPTAIDVGDQFIVVRVTDSWGGVDVRAYGISVEDPNFRPSITSVPGDQVELGEIYNYTISVEDANVGDSHGFALLFGPIGMTLDADSGELEWEPSEDDLGLHHVLVHVTDGRGGYAWQEFAVTVFDPAESNSAPRILTDLRGSIRYGLPLVAQIVAFDAEGDDLSFSLGTHPTGMTIDDDGILLWEPAAADVNEPGSPHEIVVVVSDGVNTAVERTYYLDVVGYEAHNEAPSFANVPVPSAVVNESFVHLAEATDSDGDVLVWSLVTSPPAMRIDASTGRIFWVPGDADIGTHAVQVRVDDPFGGWATKTFDLAVRGTNLPPKILSTPDTSAVAGVGYTYAFLAEDPEGKPLTYSIDEDSLLSGMTIDASGTINWSSPVAGTFEVAVTVSDGVFVVGQTYGLVVASSAPNQPPAIEPNEPQPAGVGDQFTYVIVASDPDEDALTYTLISGPTGMTLVDSVTSGVYNVLSWTPTQQQFDDQDVSPATFIVEVSDGSLMARMQFVIPIRPGNQAPTIISDAVETVVAGTVYAYDVWATDPANDPLAYSLDATSLARGMTIDSLGRIRWSPTESDIATGPHAVTVTVTDDRGGSDSQSFDITVGEDETKPNLSIDLSAPNAGNNYAIGSIVDTLIRATDNVGVTFVGLTVNGIFVSLDKAGKSSVPLTAVGNLTLIATAKDAAGNIETIMKIISVVDPADQNPPTAELLEPETGTLISEPIDLVATVDDDVPGSVNYVLAIAAVGSSEFRTLASGTGAITDEVLAQLDPTILANGSYVVRLTATDSGGHFTSDEVTVNVAGNLKLGAFSLTFTDIEIKSAGMPITVTRTYNTLNLSEQGDFGYGWQLDLSTTKIKVDHENGSGPYFGAYKPFADGTHVTVTLPDGSTEGFTFVGQPTATGFVSTNEFLPKFIPDAGVKSKLIVPSYYLIKEGSYYVDPSSAEQYSPLNPFFGNAFTLKLRNGTELAIAADTGELASITDRLGNSTQFTGDGIQTVSPTGEQLVRVEFIRDQAGRIIEIIDPNGKSLHYTYNAVGDLLSFKDRNAKQTTFDYLSGSPHYLESIVDPLGRTAATTEFYEDGRIKKVTDAANKTIEYTYELDEKTQTIKDQMGGYTTIIFDSRGNVIKEIDPVGSIVKRTWSSNDDMLTETIVVGADDAETSETDDLTTTYEYDSSGNRISTTSPRGIKTHTTYDSFGNPLTTTDEYGNVTANVIGQSGLLSSMRDVNGNLTSFAYDATGNVTQIKNTNNQILVSSTYNEFGEVTSSTPVAGRTTHFEYDDNGRQIESWYVATVDDNEVRVSDRTTYDDEGRVIATSRVTVIDSVETVLFSTSTEYNAGGQSVLETDRNGIETRYVYDLRGQLIETRRRVPDESDDLVDVVTLSVYDDAGRTIFASDPVVVAVNAAVSGALRGTYSIFDAAGRVTSSDLRRNVIVTRTGLGDNIEQYIDENDIGDLISHTQTAYGTVGRVDYTTDSFGAETHFTYNAFGDQIESRTEVKDPAGDVVWMVTRTVYDARGRVELTTDPYVDGDVVVDEPTYATVSIYDSQGRVVGSERRSGVVVSIASGDAVITNRGSLLSSTSTEFDSQGRVAKTIAADGQETTYEYDVLNRRTAVIGSKQTINGASVRHRMETHYNSLGQVDYERDNIIQFDDDTTDDSAARTTEYTYDIFGNRIGTTLSAGSLEVETSAEYDAFGRKTSEMDAVGNVTTYEYDAQGRLVAVELPAVPDPLNSNTPTHPRYEYAYDAQGNQTLIRDARGRETLFTYDEQGRQLSCTLPLGAEDAQDLIDLDDDVRDLAGISGKFTEGFWYDDRGRRTLHVSFQGVVTRYLYDDDTGAQGRLVETQFFTDLTAYDDGNGTPDETVEYVYDAFGQQVELLKSDGVSTLEHTLTGYDVEGRVQRIESLQGAIAYEYDAIGRRIRTTAAMPDAPTVVVMETRYEYDDLSRLAAVKVYERGGETFVTPQTTQYYYDLSGNLDLQTQENGVIVDYVYDGLTRLDDLIHYKPDSTPNSLADNPQIARFDYTVRDDGKRTAASEYQDGTLARTFAWTYDDIGRLTDEVFNSYEDDALDYSDHYDFDLVGNRLLKTKDQGSDSSTDESTTYAYDDNDRLLSETLDRASGDDTETSYEWGASDSATYQTGKSVENTTAGQLLEETTYSYNLQGRMSGARIERHTGGTLTERVTSTFTYGNDGIRVAATELVERDTNGSPVSLETATDETTSFLNDPFNATGYSQVLIETTFDGSYAVAKRVAHTLGRDVVSQNTATNPSIAGETFILLYDGHGSTRALLDENVAIAVVNTIPQFFAFDAFGSPLGFDPSTAATTLLFSGEQWDARVQMHYLRARYMDSVQSRFIQADPFAGDLYVPLGLQEYSYTHNDPVNGIDPIGLYYHTELGKVVHRMINALYTSEHLGNKVHPYGLTLPGAGGALVPDIMDFSLGQIAEVKPLTFYGLATGHPQLSTYLAAANGSSVTWRGVTVDLGSRIPHLGPQIPWIPSTWQVGINLLVPSTIDATFGNDIVFTVGNAFGVIYYKSFKLPKMALALGKALVFANELEKLIQRSIPRVDLSTPEDIAITEYLMDAAFYLGTATVATAGGVLATRAGHNIQRGFLSALTASPTLAGAGL